MTAARSFEVRAGARAAAHLRERGLQPADIGCVPAAAGGPKGLALIPLDRLLFDPAHGWLRDTPLELIGASIGAWRLAAAAMPDPLAALERLAQAYLGQRYAQRPTPREVAAQCRRMARAVLGAANAVQTGPGRALTVVTARARGALESKPRSGAIDRQLRSNTLDSQPRSEALHSQPRSGALDREPGCVARDGPPGSPARGGPPRSGARDGPPGSGTLEDAPGSGNLDGQPGRAAARAASVRAAFARAALANTVSRARLAAHLQRVLFVAGEPRFPARPFDAFGVDRVELDARNSEDALLASGSIPLLCEPVRNPAGAPRGDYWDGGLIDYHLLLPYAQLPTLVLYPHFAPQVTAGWLDKFLPWRRHARGHPWLANVLLISPSPAMLARLPNRKLPDRNDFYRYGLDHDARERDWRRAMAESQRFADEAMAWLERPDPSLLAPL